METVMTPHILYASQKVQDIHVPGNPLLEESMGQFRNWLHRHSFIPGEKVPAIVTPVRIEDGVLVADVSGTALSSDRDPDVRVTLRFPLSLAAYDGPLEVKPILLNVQGCHMADGGNVQNMIVNTALAVTYAKAHRAFEQQRLRLTAASSGDPFAGLPENVAAELRQVCTWYKLDIPDRVAIHVPWKYRDRTGMLAITSDPTRTNAALEKLIQEDPAFSKCVP